MAIIINNTSVVKQNAEELISESEKMSSVKDSIEYILGELNEYWEATQQDQQTFYNGLKSDVEALATVHTCNSEFANSMIEYMEVTEKTSQETIV